MKVWPQQDFHNFCVLGISDGCHGLILACLAMLAPLPSEPLDTTDEQALRLAPEKRDFTATYTLGATTRQITYY